MQVQLLTDIKEIPIDTISVKDDFMIRSFFDKNLVAEYKDNLEYIINESPILVYDTPEGLILSDGFHRLAAAKQLNWKNIKTKIKNGSVKDAYAAACLANLKHGKPLSRDERQKAIKEYIKIKVKYSNVSIAEDIGVSDETIRRYRKELEAKREIEPQEELISKNGQIQNKGSTNVEPSTAEQWAIFFSEHVKQGDALEILPSLEQKFDLIIIDPPYGITDETWDLKDKYKLLTFTRRWLNQVLGLLKPTGRLYSFWSREYMFELKPLFDEINNTYPLEFGGIIVWNFRNTFSVPHNKKCYKLTWEPIFYYYGLDAPELKFTNKDISGEKWGDERGDVWTYAIPQSNFNDTRIHPAQKPLDLYKRIIETSTNPNDKILDPFAGSGTTGHAALLTGRDFLLIENNSEYVKGIRERLLPIWTQGRTEK